MARYQGQVAVFRATVPLGVPVARTVDFPADEPHRRRRAAKKWKELGIVPSEPCTDAEFIRRASLDITGTLPTPTRSRRSSPTPTPTSATSWSTGCWSARVRLLLREQVGRHPPHQARRQPDSTSAATFASTTGSARTSPGTCPTTSSCGDPRGQRDDRDRPAGPWYRRIKATDAFVDDTAQVFLGHAARSAPSATTTRSRSGARTTTTASPPSSAGSAASRRCRRSAPAATTRSSSPPGPARSRIPRRARRWPPRRSTARSSRSRRDDDPRQKLVDWMADPKNPFFAKALVNRYWAHFFGRGIVDPLDDMRVTNPPSNPELLDALADDFVENGYDLKQLVRTICTSRVYGLSSIPNEFNARTSRTSPGTTPSGMSAEVLLDAISQVTGVPTAFAGLPGGDPGDRAAGRERRLVLPGRVRPPPARHGLRVRARRARPAWPEPDAPELRRGAGQARRGRRPGRGAREGPAARRREGRGAVLGRLRPRPVERRDRQRPGPPDRAAPTRSARPTRTSSGPWSTPRSSSSTTEGRIGLARRADDSSGEVRLRTELTSDRCPSSATP